MADYGTTLATKFSTKVLREYFAQSYARRVTNQDYEGEIRGVGSTLYIPYVGAPDNPLQTYDKSNPSLNLQNAKEIIATFTLSQKYAANIQFQDANRIEAIVKNPRSEVVREVAEKLAEQVDTFTFKLMKDDTAAGKRVGTDYTTGTVAVASDGTVTGTGTTFTSDMVGRGFKAAGHTKWYRVKQVNSATSLIIEKDVDDENATYDGGVISAGASYTIEAATPKTVNGSTTKASDILRSLRTKLGTSVPRTNRFAIVSPSFMDRLLEEDAVQRATAQGEVRTEEGRVMRWMGFDLYETEFLPSDSNGEWIVAGVPQAATLAEVPGESKIVDRGDGQDISKIWQALFLYGAKVPDIRRRMLAAAYLAY